MGGRRARRRARVGPGPGPRQADNAAMDEQIRQLGIGGGGGGLANAVLQAGFSLASHPSVTISSASAIGAKAVTDSIGPEAWSVIGPDAVVPYGRDQRFLWQLLPTRNSDGNSAVADFVQTARSVSGSVERAIDATSDKAELGVTVDLTVEELVQWAVTIDAIPNALLESISTLRTFLDSEMRYQVGLATDRHVVEQIVAANPAFTADGSDVISTARNAVADMRAAGASPVAVGARPGRRGGARLVGATDTRRLYLRDARHREQFAALGFACRRVTGDGRP